MICIMDKDNVRHTKLIMNNIHKHQNPIEYMNKVNIKTELNIKILGNKLANIINQTNKINLFYN